MKMAFDPGFAARVGFGQKELETEWRQEAAIHVRGVMYNMTQCRM